MKSYLFIALIAVATSCITNKKESAEQDVPQLTGEYTETDYGELLGEFDFQVKALPDDAKDYENGIIPWISLSETEKEIQRLAGAKEIIVPFKTVTILIDYPLNNPAEFKITSKASGFAREELALSISEKYHEIYAVEERSASQKTIPVEKREGLINRNETNGKYGVWGHDLSDLDMSSVQVYKDEEGKITILLIIES